MDLKSFEFWNSQLIPWITLLAIGCLEAMEVVLDLYCFRSASGDPCCNSTALRTSIEA